MSCQYLHKYYQSITIIILVVTLTSKMLACQVFGRPDENPAGILPNQSGFWTLKSDAHLCPSEREITMQMGALAQITEAQLQFNSSNVPTRIQIQTSMDGVAFLSKQMVI